MITTVSELCYQKCWIFELYQRTDRQKI